MLVEKLLRLECRVIFFCGISFANDVAEYDSGKYWLEEESMHWLETAMVAGPVSEEDSFDRFDFDLQLLSASKRDDASITAIRSSTISTTLLSTPEEQRDLGVVRSAVTNDSLLRNSFGSS